MALNKLYYVYGLDTSCLYTDEEYWYDRKIRISKHILELWKKKLPKIISKYGNEWREVLSHKDKKESINWCINGVELADKCYSEYKPRFRQLLQDNLNITRTVRNRCLYNKNNERSLRRRVAIFDSDLTRRFGLKEREFNTEILIVKVYFFDVARNIINNGFYMEGQKYVFFSSSAGQIRTKKLVAVREDLLKNNWNSLTSGLTIDSINAQGGMNINKYLAYLALCNSAKDLWSDFDIDKSIVVEDFETEIQGAVDYIDRDTYQITRKVMGVPVTHTDGCGMMLPCVSDRNFMVRLPWVKGLLGVFDFVRFIKEKNGNPVITDIYGDAHNIIDEDIQIIFTKSQFKMWKFFKNWTEYKENFKNYHCSAGKCNVEEDKFSDATINYQMIQTLTDLTPDEIKAISKKSADIIEGMASNKDCMLRAFGATESNPNLNGFQKCLMVYPELLSDPYCREYLKEIKKSRERELWSAKMDINGKYTFLLPDLYAFCEHLFLGIDVPLGLLKNGEVYTKLYKNKELDCLRSPHLYIEHCVRNNVKGNELSKWFITNALYTSTYDLISKVLMFDVDGDKSLIVADKTIIEAAKRNSADVVPLYYEMAKAGAKEVNNENIYEGLRLAYTGGNIGEISNAISKIWNSGNITQEKVDTVKLLVMNNNFVIDYAKTLFKPVPPKDIKRMISNYTKGKLPYFFMFAKKKNRKQVEAPNDSPVNMILKLNPQKKLNFNFKGSNIGKCDYRILMKNPDIKVDGKVVEKFRELSSKLNYKINNKDNEESYIAIFDDIREKMFTLGFDIDDVADMLIKYLFCYRKTSKKLTFWNTFGDVVYEHIKERDFSKYLECEICKKRFIPARITQKKCPSCKGYIPKISKIIRCCDCGKEFEISSKNVKSIRCADCQKEYKKKLDRERKRNNVNR